MTRCFFVSDLHGSQTRYRKLFDLIVEEKPDAVFMGGDLLPSGHILNASININHTDFINDFLAKELAQIKAVLKKRYPRFFVILGNDDSRLNEVSMLEVSSQGLWEYVNERHRLFNDHCVFGYSYVPPTPFLFKDWEKYDVSRYVDPGCVSPEEGSRSISVSQSQEKFSTISKDIQSLIKGHDLKNSIFLFHSPPYKGVLDRAALDGKMIDYVPLDLHVGSIAIQRFIENKQPFATLHGHIHESVRITGSWREKIGRTYVFGAAHDGLELALVRFEIENIQQASRQLI